MRDKIEALLKEKSSAVIAIDGRAGAGKSTLANKLAREYNGAVIRMDDFFLPPNLRIAGRVNVHYERFLIEVVPFVEKRLPFSYRVFDCSKMDYVEVKKIDMKPLIIIEGAYSLYPEWDLIYDLRIFYDIDKSKQEKRIIQRSGPEKFKDFINKWIPLEEEYIIKYNLKKRCEIIITA